MKWSVVIVGNFVLNGKEDYGKLSITGVGSEKNKLNSELRV